MDFSQVKAITIPEGNVLRILSGTTVLWEKKTGLPAEYQEVEYIESTGTQYIDTGVKVSTNNKIIMDLQFTDATHQQINGGYYIYWVNNTSYTVRNDIGVASNGMFFMGASTTSIATNVTADMNRHIFMIDATTGEWSIDDASGSVPPATHSDYEVTLLIGARRGRNVSGKILAPATYCKEKIYNVKIYVSGNLVRDFIPCYRKIDKVAGMYDVVNGVFYTNAGTGEFNVGADVIILPADYQRVEYIQGTSDANGANYINTLEYAKNTTRMEFVCEITGFPNQYERLYGVRGAFWAMQYSTTSYRFYLDKPNRATLLKTQALSSNTEYVIVQDGGTTYLNGTQIATSSQAFDTETDPDMSYAPDGKIWLNAANGGDKANSHLKIKSCMIWQNGVLNKHFVPCYRKIDNVPGMYDLVNDVFYTNPGTGSFTVGPDIITIPSGYQKVEYIESSGTQYIRTAVPPSDDFRMDLKVYTTCVDSFYCAGLRIGGDIIFGQTGPTANNRVSASVNGSSATASTDGVQWSRSASGQTYEIMLRTNGDGTFTYHIEDLTNEKEFLAENRSYTLMGDRTSGVFISSLNSFYILNGTNQFYYFRLYKNGEVAFDGIPCYRKSDNVVGLYDLVSKELLVNAGTGSFTAGPDV